MVFFGWLSFFVGRVGYDFEKILETFWRFFIEEWTSFFSWIRSGFEVEFGKCEDYFEIF